MYILVPFQEVFDYFCEHLAPYERTDTWADDHAEWFDRWLDWLVGAWCIEGNDCEYLYEWSVMAKQRLLDFDIPHRIVDEEGNEICTS